MPFGVECEETVQVFESQGPCHPLPIRSPQHPKHPKPRECPPKPDAPAEACKITEPGGKCSGVPTGAGDCTWNYENAGELQLTASQLMDDGGLDVCVHPGQ